MFAGWLLITETRNVLCRKQLRTVDEPTASPSTVWDSDSGCLSLSGCHVTSVLFSPGTASVAVAGVIAAMRITKTKLSENKYLFFGAGEVSHLMTHDLFQGDGVSSWRHVLKHPLSSLVNEFKHIHTLTLLGWQLSSRNSLLRQLCRWCHRQHVTCLFNVDTVDSHWPVCSILML